MASNISQQSALRGQVPVRPKGSPKCPYHRNNDVIYLCNECEELICAKCSVTTHKSHINSIDVLSDLDGQHRDNVRDFVNDAENNRIPGLENEIQSNPKKILGNSQFFQGLVVQMKERNELCKQELDTLTAQYVSTCDQMEELNRDLLVNHKKESQKQKSVLVDFTKECNHILQTGNSVSLYDTVSDIRYTHSGNSETLPLRMAYFSTCEGRLLEQLKKAFGDLRTSDNKHETPKTDHGISNQQRPREHKTEIVSEESPCLMTSSYTLLDKSKLVSIFTIPDDILCTTICPTAAGLCWFSFFNSDTILLINNEGKTIQETVHDAIVTDISINPNSGHLWLCCYTKHTVSEVLPSSQFPVTRFKTEDTPLCLCITKDGHVAMGMWGAEGTVDKQHKVTLYKTDGEMLQTIAEEDSGIGEPITIKECPVTSNIAIVSKNDDEIPYVVVFDKTLQVKFHYKGQIRPEESPRLDFVALSAVFDSYGNILVANKEEDTIDLVSGDGKYIKTISNSGEWLQLIGIQKGDLLWALVKNIHTNSRKMKIIEYYRH